MALLMSLVDFSKSAFDTEPTLVVGVPTNVIDRVEAIRLVNDQHQSTCSLQEERFFACSPSLHVLDKRQSCPYANNLDGALKRFSATPDFQKLVYSCPALPFLTFSLVQKISYHFVIFFIF